MRAITTNHKAISTRLQRFKRHQDKPLEKSITINPTLTKQNIIYDQTIQKSMNQIITMITIFYLYKYYHCTHLIGLSNNILNYFTSASFFYIVRFNLE